MVLLHGLGASSGYWETLAEPSSGFAAVAPDLLGFGRSPKPPDASYDVNCHLEALAPLLPAGAVVVAHSTGATPAASEWISPPGVTDAREPWVFVVGRDGRITHRFDNVATDGELEGAVQDVVA